MSKIASSKGIYEIIVDSTKANTKGEVYVICPICRSARKPEHQKKGLLK